MTNPLEACLEYEGSEHNQSDEADDSEVGCCERTLKHRRSVSNS